MIIHSKLPRLFLKSILPFCLFAFLSVSLNTAQASPGDTTIIRFHNKVNMDYNGAYDFKGKFPDSSKTYRQVLMKYTMGCSSNGCSGWDYTTKILYLKPTAVFDSSILKIDTTSGKHDTSWKKTERMEPFELGRVITPYGTYMKAGSNGYNNNWQHRHWFDITDYISLLKDSATIRAFYDGWTTGFSVTLDFYFIEGTPSRNVLKIENLWGNGGNGYGYSVSDTFEKYVMYPKAVNILPNAKSAQFHFTPSGHGFDNDQYAAEFYDEWANVNYNHQKIGDMHIWRDDCGKNPIGPQGGTWVYNRANWCPGSKVNTFNYDLASSQIHPGAADTIDVNFAPYIWKGNQGPSYIISSTFVQYGPTNFSDDAGMKDIIAPSSDENYAHQNPACYNPVIEIKNNGANTLTKCTIKYGLSNGPKTLYIWQGTLPFNQVARITLPTFNWTGAVNGSLFEAELLDPNSKTDEWNYDNKMSAPFNITPVHNPDIVIWLRTNKRPGENSYKIIDWNNNIVFEKKGLTQQNFVYKDTVHLAVGCYKMILTDTGGNGLSWWADTAQGTGYLRFRNYAGISVKSFEADFGEEIIYYFTTSYSVGLKNISEESRDIQVYPNPAHGLIIIEFTDPPDKAKVQLLDITGRIVFEDLVNGAKNTISTREYQRGIYFINVITQDGTYTRKIIFE
jgi:hypothetical protein